MSLVARVPVLSLVLTLASLFSACGGADKPADSAADESDATARSTSAAETPATSSPAKPAEPADAKLVPSDCHASGDLCVPPAAFVKKLCDGAHPEVAFAFLRKGTPFTRAYLAGNTKAWNASGGASGSNDQFVFDEEVVVLIARTPESGSGIQVSGASGSYDVLRWDGTCATLSREEITFKVPPRPIAAQLIWKDLPENVQNALLEDPGIAKMNKERRNECKGISVGEVTSKCAKIVDKLSVMISDYVRGGGVTPVPAKLP